jgi:hypothetical protein
MKGYLEIVVLDVNCSFGGFRSVVAFEIIRCGHVATANVHEEKTSAWRPSRATAKYYPCIHLTNKSFNHRELPLKWWLKEMCVCGCSVVIQTMTITMLYQCRPNSIIFMPTICKITYAHSQHSMLWMTGSKSDWLNLQPYFVADVISGNKNQFMGQVVLKRLN